MCKCIKGFIIVMIFIFTMFSTINDRTTFSENSKFWNKELLYDHVRLHTSSEDVYDRASLEAFIKEDSKIFDLYQLLFRVRDLNSSIYPGASIPPRFFYAVETYQRSAEYMFKTGWSNNLDNFTNYVFVWIQTGNRTWLKRALKILNWALNSYLYNSTTGLFSKDSSGLSTEISFPLWYLYIFTHNNTYRRILERMLYGLLNAMMNVNSTFYRNGILSRPYLYIPPHMIYIDGKLQESDYTYYACIWIGGSLYMLQIIDFLDNQTLLEMYKSVLNETFYLLYDYSSGKPFLWEFYNPFTGSKTVYWGVPQTRTFFFPILIFVSKVLEDNKTKRMILNLTEALDRAFWSKSIIGSIRYLPYRIWNPSTQLEKYAAPAVVTLSYLREKFHDEANITNRSIPEFPGLMHFLFTVGIGDDKPIYYWEGPGSPAVYHYVKISYDSSSDKIKKEVLVHDWSEFTLDYYLSSAPYFLEANYPYWGGFLWKKIIVYWKNGSGFYDYYGRQINTAIPHTITPFIYLLGKIRPKWYPLSLINLQYISVFANITKEPKEVRMMFMEKLPGLSVIWIPLGNKNSEYADPYYDGSDAEYLYKVEIESNSSALRWVADKHGLILLYSEEPVEFNLTAKISIGIEPSDNEIHGFWYDSDLNGLIDAWEYLYNATNPESDDDFDGLKNLDEQLFFANPFNNDSDCDGLSDLIEFNISSNPLFRDTDYDGVFDCDEVKANLDPLDPLSGCKNKTRFIKYDFLAYWGRINNGEEPPGDEDNNDNNNKDNEEIPEESGSLSFDNTEFNIILAISIMFFMISITSCIVIILKNLKKSKRSESKAIN